MRSVRLSDDLERELESLSNQKKVSKSEIVKEALVEYIAKEKKYNRPYESGQNYFGKYGSEETDRSATYKSRIKEKIREKKSD